MPLTPQDIVRREFREALRGYNQADVDLFLDEVVEEFGRLTEENQKMKVRLAAVQQEVARLREGRGGAPGAGSPREDPHRLDTEVRARVRRFLEEQIRLVDAAPTPTVERIAREVPKPVVDTRAGPAGASPVGSETNEPFWAGE